MNTFDLTHALRDVRTNSVIAICLLIKRDCKMFTAMACLCILLGGPSYAAGAESLIIAGATYYEPGVSGSGWAWTDADHLELNGYAGEAIGAEDDLVLTLAGQNSVTESHAPDADITLCGMEVWGDLTLRGAGSGAGVRAYGVYLQDAGLGAGAAGCRVSVDASWLDAAGADGGVTCTGGSLVTARLVSPAGGAFGAGSVVDASGAVAPHAVVEPDVATPPAGETGGGEVSGGGTGEPDGSTGPAAGQPGAGPTTDPAMKPSATTTKTTKTTVTKTTASTSSKPKATTATAATLPKTADNNWIAASLSLFLLGLALFGAAYRC